MTSALRYAFASFLAIGVAASISGCKADCDQEGNKTTCVGETTVQFISSTPTTKSAPWAAGQAVKIAVTGGAVRTGSNAATSITVSANPDASVQDVRVKFTPTTNRVQGERDKAIQEMKLVEEGGGMALSADSSSGAVLISAKPDSSRLGSVSNGLTALVDVLVPQSFNGVIEANSATGDIQVNVAPAGGTVFTGLGDVAVLRVGGPLSATTDLGDVQAEIINANVAGAGTVFTKQGTAQLTVPTAANISIQAQANQFDNKIFLDPGLPSTWQANAAVPDVSVTYCGNAACTGTSAGNWKVASEFGGVNLVFR